jgi:hypothetical protein
MGCFLSKQKVDKPTINRQYNKKIEYQTITYVLPKPYVGQKIILTINGIDHNHKVTGVNYDGSSVDSFCVSVNENVYIFDIVRGKWELRDYDYDYDYDDVSEKIIFVKF